VQVTNVAGAGGTVGLPQFVNQWKGQGNALMVGGMVMVGAIIANKSAVKLSAMTPIALLTGEAQALVVPASSPFKNAKDFAAAAQGRPDQVPVAGGLGWRLRHILLGMIAKARRAHQSYVAFAGGDRRPRRCSATRWRPASPAIGVREQIRPASCGCSRSRRKRQTASRRRR
jgi:putative tricarboxylic transport membrane protein